MLKHLFTINQGDSFEGFFLYFSVLCLFTLVLVARESPILIRTQVRADWIRGHDFFWPNLRRGHNFFLGNSRRGHDFAGENSRRSNDFFRQISVGALTFSAQFLTGLWLFSV